MCEMVCESGCDRVCERVGQMIEDITSTCAGYIGDVVRTGFVGSFCRG